MYAFVFELINVCRLITIIANTRDQAPVARVCCEKETDALRSERYGVISRALPHGCMRDEML